MNLVNTTLSQKYRDPSLKVSIYGSVLKCSLYTPVVSNVVEFPGAGLGRLGQAEKYQF
jgi:hypothetical protein